MTRLAVWLLACLAAAIVVATYRHVVATYRHLERAMRRTGTAPVWVEPYDGEAMFT